MIPIANPNPHPHAHPSAGSRDDSPAAESRLRRAASKTGDGDGSDDGASTRDGDEGSPAFRFSDPLALEGKIGLSGHPCAAGCGHVCWVTNIPVMHDSVGSDS